MPKDRNISPRPQAARLTRPLTVVLCLALVVRVGILLLTPSALSADPDGYWRLAENVAQHGTLGHSTLEHGDVPSAFRPPVYPLLLAPCAMLGGWSKAGVGALHVAMGVATVWLIFGLAVRMGLKRWAPVAALLVAFDPILLRQSTLIMTETTATLLATAALAAIALLLERPTAARAAWVGLALAAAALCRPVFLPWMVCSLVMLFFVLKPPFSKHVLSAAVVACVVLAPWAIRNQIQFGRPILTTTHGGYTLYLANNPWFYDYLSVAPSGDTWDAQELGTRWHLPPDELTPKAELANDREAYDAALATIRDEPRIFCYSCMVRVGRLWAVMPHQGPHQVPGRWLVAVWYSLEFLLAALGCWTICRTKTVRSPLWLWALLLIVCITAVHLFFWTNMRMRAPLQPVIALAAAAGLLTFRRQGSVAKGSQVQR